MSVTAYNAPSCLVFEESLDELTQIVTGMFSAVENKNLPVPVCTECPFTDNELQVGGLGIQGDSNVYCVLYLLMYICMYMFHNTYVHMFVFMHVYTLLMYLLTYTLCLLLLCVYIRTYIRTYELAHATDTYCMHVRTYVRRCVLKLFQ